MSEGPMVPDKTVALPLPVADLLERAVRGVRPHENHKTERWVCVMEAFALGSTYSIQLCRHYGLDPHALIKPPPRRPT